MDERLRIEFNEWARVGRGESMEQGHRPVGEQAIARLRVPARARVLDVGCGSGWATRLLAERAKNGVVVGIDIADEMISIARKASASFTNIDYRVASAEKLPFESLEFSHAFSMESLYYYDDVLAALKEIRRVLDRHGVFVAIIDLYQENRPSHQWIENLNVPVHLLSIRHYRSLFEQAGFTKVHDERLHDPAPIPDNYSGGSFKTREDYIEYRETGSLMLIGGAER
jgi:ubiquinone/menaquinone biosynthesis C-methylase UbiE